LRFLKRNLDALNHSIRRCEQSEAIQKARNNGLDCFALLAMTDIYLKMG